MVPRQFDRLIHAAVQHGAEVDVRRPDDDTIRLDIRIYESTGIHETFMGIGVPPRVTDPLEDYRVEWRRQGSGWRLSWTMANGGDREELPVAEILFRLGR